MRFNKFTLENKQYKTTTAETIEEIITTVKTLEKQHYRVEIKPKFHNNSFLWWNISGSKLIKSNLQLETDKLKSFNVSCGDAAAPRGFYE